MPVKVYFVMAPPPQNGPDPEWEAERMVFIKDGVSLWALLVPVVWLLWHRMWIPLLAYLAYLVAVSGIELSFGNPVSAIIALGLAFLFALEANNLRRWSLAAKGWRLVGEAVGRSRSEAEFLFFRDWAGRSYVRQGYSRGGDAAAATAKRGAQAGRSPAAGQSDDEPAIFGLFPEADR